MSKTIIAFPLVGPAGEPVAFAQTITGHGVTSLAPFRLDEERSVLHATLSLPGRTPRRVTVRASATGHGEIAIPGPKPDENEAAAIRAAVRHVLRLDEDLSPFYALAAADPALAWVTSGAGRLTRCQTVFEEVVKTICTTNCAWTATVRMVAALVAELGEAADGVTDGTPARAFPTPEAMANADEAFYRTRVRCGYRGPYLRSLAEAVAGGRLDLERFATVPAEELPDDGLAKELLALPGVGPYAASHIMLMLGRYSRPIFDSWTRPTYAAATGEPGLTDREITERFAPYGRYAGLAFWMTVTKSWHIATDPAAVPNGETAAVEGSPA